MSALHKTFHTPAFTILTMPNQPKDQPAEQDPRVYFAAERTFLARIRTGLGLMLFR